MTNEYQINISGLGSFVVNADVVKVKSKKSNNLECEIEIIEIKKFNEDEEIYLAYEASTQELLLLEKEVAITFFRQLH